MLCCFITGICVFFFFWLTAYYRHGHNFALLKFTIKQLEIVLIHLVWHRIDTSLKSRPSVSVSQSKMAAKAWNPRSIPSIHDQYPWDIVKPRGTEKQLYEFCQRQISVTVIHTSPQAGMTRLCTFLIFLWHACLTWWLRKACWQDHPETIQLTETADFKSSPKSRKVAL